MRKVPGIVFSLACVIAVAGPAVADPIQVTSGGVMTAFGPVAQHLDGEELSLIGAGLHIVDSLEDPIAFVQLANPPAAVPGVLIDLSGVFRVEDVLGGMVNAVFGVVNAPFQLSLQASPATLACSSEQPFRQCTATAPFTMSGKLTFTPFDGVPFTQQLVGGGIATGQLFRSASSGDFAQVTYTFAPIATPEPASLLLLATGLLAMTHGVLRRRCVAGSSM